MAARIKNPFLDETHRAVCDGFTKIVESDARVAAVATTKLS
jgi:hypothetical protein